MTLKQFQGKFNIEFLTQLMKTENATKINNKTFLEGGAHALNFDGYVREDVQSLNQQD